MGVIWTKVMRPVKAFNIENRARRVISKEKPTPAPLYPGNVEDLKRVSQIEPDINEKLDKKDIALDDRLKGVYVTAHGKPEDDITKFKQSNNPNRPLPQFRKTVEDFDFGVKEPDTVPYGRTTLRSVLNFIQAHQLNPEELPPSKIALEYKLNEADVVNILKYFKPYEVYIPETKTSPAKFAGPATLRKSLNNTNDTKIDSKERNENMDIKEKNLKDRLR